MYTPCRELRRVPGHICQSLCTPSIIAKTLLQHTKMPEARDPFQP